MIKFGKYSIAMEKEVYHFADHRVRRIYKNVYVYTYTQKTADIISHYYLDLVTFFWSLVASRTTKKTVVKLTHSYFDFVNFSCICNVFLCIL